MGQEDALARGLRAARSYAVCASTSDHMSVNRESTSTLLWTTYRAHSSIALTDSVHDGTTESA